MNHTLLIKNAPSTNNFYDVKSPFSGEVIASVEKADKESCEIALRNATESFEKVMKKMPAWQRAEILYKVAEEMKTNHEELSMTIAKEGGKPLKDARIEVTRAINTVKMSGDEALQLNGEQLTMDRSKGSESQLAFTMRVPIGPVLAISAFNHPVNLICHQVATAIAAGNSVIVKPASQTPLSCLTLAKYFYEAGLPKEVLSVTTVGGTDSEVLVTDPRIRFLTFIGGETVGWDLRKKIQPGVKISLELGGIGTAILDKTADLSKAIPSIVKGAFYHAGQVCVSTQNLYVHKDIAATVLSQLKDTTELLKTGDATEIATDVGPLITTKEQERVANAVEEAVSQGAMIVTGGTKLGNNCYTPTILTNVTRDMAITHKEIFGPVLNVFIYENIDDVINEMNSANYSFQSAIYTKDIDLALSTAKKVDCMGFMINNATAFRVDWMPFGGSKHSGVGVGGMRYAIHEMTEEKLVVINVT